MKRNRIIPILTIFLSTLLIIFSSGIVFAQSEPSTPSVCCERTQEGAICINTNEEECDQNFHSSPTSCETTSYCRLGTCYDSSEGICMDNVPQQVCSDNGGSWDERSSGEVPQCQLGCCIIGDQAAFVPLVRCKKLSTFFGVENNYRNDITSEVACIATAQAQDKGACVYEKDFERICEFTTRADCGASEEVGTLDDGEQTSQKRFYKDFLCSAEELNTACARQTSTGCNGGKVYWKDSCGNLENVYSSDKEQSWNNGRVADPDEICNPHDGTNNNCGNCDYLLGSRCSRWDGVLGLGKPADSEYYCRNTECVDRNGDPRLNGESWCVNDGYSGNGLEPVGARAFREICIDGEVRVEPCADFRNEICIEGSIDTSAGDFSTAGCRVNRWQTCTFQVDEDDCTNINKRDCIWLPMVKGVLIEATRSASSGGFSNPGGSFNNPTAGGGSSDSSGDPDTERDIAEGICAPNYSPGLAFWEDSGAKSTCGQASATCIVIKEKKIGGSWHIVEGEECTRDQWALEANRICTALGDCGGYVNYVRDYTDDGYEWTIDGKEKRFSRNTVNKISGGFTGLIFKEL
jgi:hypothetical protein